MMVTLMTKPPYELIETECIVDLLLMHEDQIHVIYIDDAGSLNERVKLVESGQWETIPFPDDIKHQATPTSKLHSGVCHDASLGGHHWVFFEA
jgi:hypothetical protein